MIRALTIVGGLVALAILDRRAERRERQRAAAPAPTAPDLYITRDDAIAAAVNACSDGEFVVIHHNPCTDACRCERPEVYRVARGQA